MIKLYLQRASQVKPTPSKQDFYVWVALVIGSFRGLLEERELKITRGEKQQIESLLRANAQKLNALKPLTLVIRLVGVKESQQLNKRYRQIDRATNILSFGSEESDYWGDLVICLPKVVEEAEEQQKTWKEHFAHLTIHGTLHLLGFGHQTSVEAGLMEKVEIELLRHLSIANPYV